jgi:DNA-binding NarL/FixJ family response regulator
MGPDETPGVPNLIAFQLFYMLPVSQPVRIWQDLTFRSSRLTSTVPLNIATPARPRVLLADDHVDVLQTVSRHLAAAFDIVAIAADGRQALDLARRLRPDLVVLDISMPALNGFQTLEQLRRDGLDTRIVFLTMHSNDEFVAAAINAGALGYVLKSRIHLDLISAIDHALAGRLFVPSLTSLSAVAGGRHTVQFHANDRHFLDEVSRLVGATLRSGEQVVIVTSEATRMGIAQRLEAQQMNPAMLAERGQYIAQDSALALAHVMHEGRPDKERVADMVNGLGQLRLAAPNGPRGRLTIFGDMSASLCRNGDFEAALELERVWDELTRALPLFTICGYPIGCFENSEALNLMSNVCAAHSAVTFGTSRGTRATST